MREVRSWPTSLGLDDAGEDNLTRSSWCKELFGEDTDVGGGDEWEPSISTLRKKAKIKA